MSDLPILRTSLDLSINKYSQHGEEPILKWIFGLIGDGDKRCMEFGAADGFFCSNTALFWKELGWHAILVEPEQTEFDKLLRNTQGYDVDIHLCNVTNTDDFANYPLDLLSIDVDGEEYDIWERTHHRHRVVVVEHNPTFPPHVEYHGGRWQGSSALTLCNLAENKGYHLVAATKTNLIFVRNEEINAFMNFDQTLDANFVYTELNYVVTDYHGNFDIIGKLPYSMVHRTKMAWHAHG